MQSCEALGLADVLRVIVAWSSYEIQITVVPSLETPFCFQRNLAFYIYTTDCWHLLFENYFMISTLNMKRTSPFSKILNILDQI